MRIGLASAMLLLLVVLGGCAGTTAKQTASPAPPAPGVELRQLRSGGLARSYWYLDPGKSDSVARPLLLVLHGTGSNGSQMIRLGRFAAKSRAAGFVLIAPNAVGRAFNDGSGRIGTAHQDVDDVAFIDAIIRQVRSSRAISQVFVTGFSSGAAMAQRLALELGNDLDGVAAVGGHLWAPLLDEQDAPVTPVPMLLIFGTRDPLNPVDGGAVKYGPDLVIHKPSQSTTAKRWANLYGCSTTISGTVQMLRQTSWHGCRDNVTVTLVTIDGLGHYWPGGTVTRYTDLPASVTGPWVSSMNATDVIWDYFSRLPKTGTSSPTSAPH